MGSFDVSTQDRACFALVKRNTTHNTLASIGKVHATATSHRWTTETQGLWTQSSKMHVTCSSKSSFLCETHVGFLTFRWRASAYSILCISQLLVCHDVFSKVLSTNKQHLWGLSHAKKLMVCHISCVALHYLQRSSVSACHPYFEELRVNYIKAMDTHYSCVVGVRSSLPVFQGPFFTNLKVLAGIRFKLYLSSPLEGSLQMLRLTTNGFSSFGMNSYTFSYCQHGCRIPENCQFNLNLSGLASKTSVWQPL